MDFFETIRTALLDLATRKFRSALATLGIMFAVASVLAMISISDGARRETLNRIALLGVDNIILRTVKPPKPEIAPNANQQPRQYINDYGLKRRDLSHIRDTFALVRHAIGVKNARQSVYSKTISRKLDLPVLATEPDYLKVTRSRLLRGRFLNDADLAEKINVCVIGSRAAQKVFAWIEPVGESLRIGDDWYTVVGVIHNDAAARDAGGDDIANAVFIPFTTAMMRYGDVNVQQEAGSTEVSKIELDAIYVQLEDQAAVEPTAQRLAHYMSINRQKQDYELVVPLELMNQSAATQRIFTIVMASIAGISLLIGGIGIMNIMLANVSERRKEIGTRRALGARRLDIVRQFLVESATLTTLGGLVGLALGYALSRAVANYAGWPTYIAPFTVGLSLSVSIVSGLLFGLWPAWVAANTNPIEALRSD
jgi:putative ABC transport system permease protein